MIIQQIYLKHLTVSQLLMKLRREIGLNLIKNRLSPPPPPPPSLNLKIPLKFDDIFLIKLGQFVCVNETWLQSHIF